MSEDRRPLLRVVKGDPTPEEVAALLAVVLARRAAAVEPARQRRSAWGHPATMTRSPVSVGPGGWRASARPA